MKNFSKTKKLLILCIVLNLVVWTAYGVIFWQIKSQNEKISLLVNEAELDTKKEEDLRLTKASLNENKDSISRIDSYFIPKDGVVDFINSLESLGKQSGTSLVIGSVSVESETKIKENFKEVLRLKVQAIGSWKNVMHFLSILENLPYQVDLQQADFKLSVSAEGSSGGGVPQWEGDFEFTLLKLK